VENEGWKELECVENSNIKKSRRIGDLFEVSRG